MRQKTSKFNRNFVNELLNSDMHSIKEENDLELNKNHTVISKPSMDAIKTEDQIETLEIGKFNKLESSK